jgi:hypothetical protein
LWPPRPSVQPVGKFEQGLLPGSDVPMREIRGDAKTVRALLSGTKYGVDYCQREYKWETKQGP